MTYVWLIFATSLKSISFIIAAIVVIPFLSPVALAQQDRASVIGQVVDQKGAGIDGAVVTMRPKAGGLEHRAITDVEGLFRFPDLAEGEYYVSAIREGFSTHSQALKVRAGETREIAVTLRAGNISEKIIVTATRTEAIITDTPSAVSVVGRKDIERQTLATIGDLFRKLPGAATVGEGPFQVRPRIRGLDSNRVLILVDGERLNNTRTSTSNSGIEIGLVGVDQIESIEVVRGSGSVLYGTDALAGTINIITRDALPRQYAGFRFGGGFNGFYSSNETGRRGSAYLTGAGSLFAFRFAQTLDRFDNYHSGGESGGMATTVFNSQYHGGNTQLVGRFFISEAHLIKTSFERRRASNIGVPAVAGIFTAFFPFSNRDKVSARYEGYNLSTRLARVSASVYYQSQDRNFSNELSIPAAPPAFPGSFQFSETVTETTTTGFDVQTNWSLGLDNVLTVGASYFRDHNNDSRFIKRLSPDFSIFPPGLVRSEDRSRSVPDAAFGDFALFAQNEHQLTHRLKLLAGVRVDRFDIDSERTSGFGLPPFFTPSQIEDLNLGGLSEGLRIDDTAVSGDLGAVFKPVSEISLTARVGSSFREPNLFERFFTDFGSAAGFVIGNPSLDPESGVNFDTGIRLRTSRFAGGVAYFNNTYKNFLTSSPAFDRSGMPITINPRPGQPPVPVFQTINTDSVRIQGIEADFEASLTLLRHFFAPFGNVTYLRGDNRESDTPLDFITPVKTIIGLRIQDRRDRYWSEYGARIVHRQERLSPRFLIVNGGPEPGFVSHDLRGGINFRREHQTLRLTLAVENLANRLYSEQFVFAPARGRSATVGVSVNFF